MCGCNKSDKDSDYDGVPDCKDGCPYDSNKVTPGFCGCGESEQDSDHDGFPDCVDQCPDDPHKHMKGRCGCHYRDSEATCCQSYGVHSIPVKYGDDGHRSHCMIKVHNSSLVHTEPDMVFNVQDGAYVTFFGKGVHAYDEYPVFGDGDEWLEFSVYDEGSDEYYHHVKIRLSCDHYPPVGMYDSYFDVHRVTHYREGERCHDDDDSSDEGCHYKVALALDTSYWMSLEAARNIRRHLTWQVIQRYAGTHMWLSIYTSDKNARLYRGYLDLWHQDNVNKAITALEGLKFQKEIGYEGEDDDEGHGSGYNQEPYSNWDDLFQLVYAQNDEASPDVLLFVVGGWPTLCADSHTPGYHYTPGEYSAPLAAAVESSKKLKSRGTRIVPVVVAKTHTGQNTTLNVAAVQSIANGPNVDYDYFLSGGSRHMDLALNLAAKHLCCKSSKDLCGVCYGRNRDCADCAGLPYGSHTRDHCGVCGGAGTTCDPLDCHGDGIQVSVHESSGLTLRTFEGKESSYDLVEFCYHGHYLGDDTILVVGFEPYQECKLYQRGTCENLLPVHDGSVYSGRYQDYCKLFDQERMLSKSNVMRWKNTTSTAYSQDDYHQLVTCANFTVSDLLYSCKDSDLEQGGLVSVAVPWKRYTGTVYGTLVKKPKICTTGAGSGAGGWSLQHCNEHVLYSAQYPFEISVDTDGDAVAIVLSDDLTYSAYWEETQWTSEGDLVIEFSTLIQFFHESHYTYLWSPQVDSSLYSQGGANSSVPFHVDQSYAPDNCTASEVYNHQCKQYWRVRTYGAGGVQTFNSTVAVRFLVYVDGLPVQEIWVKIKVDIQHGDSPGAVVKAHLRYDAWLGLYRDPDFQHQVSAYDSIFVHKDFIYGRVVLHKPHDDIYETPATLYVDRIEICTSTDARGKDLVDYDPEHPETTGCNTQGVEVVRYTLYQRDLDYKNELFAFELLQTGAGNETLNEAHFRFLAKAVCAGKQLVHVHWHTPFVVHPSDYHNALVGSEQQQQVSQIASFALGSFAEHIPVLPSLTHQRSTLHAQYPMHLYGLPSLFSRQQQPQQQLVSEVAEHTIDLHVVDKPHHDKCSYTSDDDDDDQGDDDIKKVCKSYHVPNSDVHQDNHHGISVHCPAHYHYKDHDCYEDLPESRNSIAVFIIVGLLFIFCIAAGCWGCSSCYQRLHDDCTIDNVAVAPGAASTSTTTTTTSSYTHQYQDNHGHHVYQQQHQQHHQHHQVHSISTIDGTDGMRYRNLNLASVDLEL